ncbi:MAG: tetratricopeptide repeat protein [Bacteroidia bacterium]|nr:tetratricopeptide repeat protein [Bacteroidia bacterium]MDW8301213.1 tetratricopeptide repeat protein [Bacteroidia bacterium]
MKKHILILILFSWLCSLQTILAQQSKITNAGIHLNNGEFEEALKNVDEALANESTKNEPKAYFYRVRALVGIAGNPKLFAKYPNAGEEAYQAYKKTMELDTKGKYKEDLVKIYVPQISLILFNGALTELKEKKYNTAKEKLKKVADMNPLDVKKPVSLQYHTVLGQAAYFDGDFTLAKATLSQLVEKNAEDPTAYLTLSNIYNQEKNFEQALSILQKGKSVNEALIAKINKSIDSIKSTKGFNEKDPTYKFLKEGLDACIANKVRMRNEEFNIYIRQGTIDQKINELKQEVEKDPNDVALRYLYGKVSEPKDKDKAEISAFKTSIEQYKKVIELNPTYFDALYDLGAIYLREGKRLHDAAEELFLKDKAKSEEMEKSSKEHFNIALGYLERANEIQPRNADLINALRSLYISSGQIEKANLVKCRIDPNCTQRLYSRKQLENMLVGKKREVMTQEIGNPKDPNGKKNPDGTVSVFYERISYDGDNFKNPDAQMEVIFDGAKIKELKFQ